MLNIIIISYFSLNIFRTFEEKIHNLFNVLLQISTELWEKVVLFSEKNVILVFVSMNSIKSIK